MSLDHQSIISKRLTVVTCFALLLLQVKNRCCFSENTVDPPTSPSLFSHRIQMMNRRTSNFRRRGHSYYQTNDVIGDVNGGMEMASRGKDNTTKQKRRRNWVFPLSMLVSISMFKCIYSKHYVYTMTNWNDERQIQEVLTLVGEDPVAKWQFGLISCIG